MTLTDVNDPRYVKAGQLVARLRMEQGYSQEALALAAGLSTKTVQRIEKGTHAAHGGTFRKLAEALDVPPRQLLAPLFEDEPNL